MFDFSELSPMQIGRINSALDKRYNFSTLGIMTLRRRLERESGMTKKTGDHSYEFNRTKFNRMNGKEQAVYEARLNRPDYQVCFSNGLQMSIPKIVYDVLNVQEA